MRLSFFIPGEFSGLNEYTHANRANIHQGAAMKKDETQRVVLACRGLPKVTNYPVSIGFTWYTKDLRRDADNVAFAKKFILDGLVKASIIVNDSRRYVAGFEQERFYVDADNPGVEVNIFQS